MSNWVTRYWLPFLLLALVLAGYLELRSVETVEIDAAGRMSGAREAVSEPRPVPQKAVPEPPPVAISRLGVGARYASLQELDEDQKAAGFVRIGYFGKQWPARVAEVASERDELSFVRQDGTRHTYQKFEGYALKMGRLEEGDKETIVVFRSGGKR